MRCEAFLSKDYLRARRGLEHDGRCRRVVDFEIGGEQLCCEHASLRALTKVIDLGMAVRVARTSGEAEYRHLLCPQETGQ